MQCHSTPTKTHNCATMTTQGEPLDLSKVDGLIIKPGKNQHPIKWFRCQFNQIYGLELNREQLTPLLSADKQSFVPDILEQIQTLIRNHMSELLMTIMLTNRLNGTRWLTSSKLSMPCPLHA